MFDRNRICDLFLSGDLVVVLCDEDFVCFCGGCRFVWDEARYPTMSPLKEIIDGIHGQVAKIEDDLKVIHVS